MNSQLITYLEFILVGIIVVIQTIQARGTRIKIQTLKSIIPQIDFFKIKKYNIPIIDLLNFQPNNILENLNKYDPNYIEPIIENEYKEFEYTFDNLKELTISEIIELVRNDFGEEISSRLKSDVIDEAIAINERYTDINGQFNIPFKNENTKTNNDLPNEISLINPNDSSNSHFENLLNSINVYLLRNKGATADFNLIKDIIERNIDAEEEDISQTVTVPLYLGLMGTMLGIVFGLVNLFLVSDSNVDFEIQGFLGGVSIAMFASFYGLSLTVYNSSYLFKEARRIVERSKNNFYTFIQTELLPILNQSVSSSVHSLHENLNKFNLDFTQNLNHLSGLMNKNYDALTAQEKILSSLEKIDITEFAKANIKVLKELKTGTESLEKFNQYLNGLNYLTEGTVQLSKEFQLLLSKVNNFQGLAEKLDSRIEESNKLVTFLNDHYGLLNERGELLRESVIKVEDVIVKSLVNLEIHTQTKIDAIKQLTIKEEDLMTQSFAENRSHFSKLSILSDLNKSLEGIKSNSVNQINNINSELNSLKESIERTNIILNEIKNTSLIGKTQNVAKSFRKFIKGKK